ncbi:MAG TPA: ABC transporter permease [Trueperaceae bacterium]
MSGYSSYLLQRLAGVVVTVAFVAITIFLMVRLLPGDPARVIAGVLASEQDVARIRVQLGLDQPLWTQAGIFLGNLIHGDLGTSARTSTPVVTEISARLAATTQLALVSTLLAIMIGVPLGALAAARAGGITDLIVSTLVLFGISMPVYWLGLMLIILFSIRLQWLPAAGADGPLAIVLPAVTLAFFSVAFIARITRSSMLEVLRQDYVRTATAKGVRRRVVLWRHALRNALAPVITVIGLQFGELLGGAILTETVFGWPGLGRLLVDSIFSRDYPMVQGLVIVFALMFALVNLVVDLLYERIDPRVSYG